MKEKIKPNIKPEIQNLMIEFSKIIIIIIMMMMWKESCSISVMKIKNFFKNPRNILHYRMFESIYLNINRILTTDEQQPQNRS